MFGLCLMLAGLQSRGQLASHSYEQTVAANPGGQGQLSRLQ